ncbi:MAG: LacI family DNA-binding transcriptional regulator [Phaeodactylibacter sp.]|nr:LacI family DNA-binding transcriptional regulator [Phaeodactylibacter sp.]
MKKNITIYDISKALGLSASSVSRALKDHPRISIKTKELVKKKAKELGYKPNQIAASLRTGASSIVGVIIPTIHHNFFSKVISGLEEVLAQNNLATIITQSHESLDKEKANLDVLLNTHVLGVIASISKQTQNLDHFKRLLNRNIPVIIFDRTTKNPITNSVVVDDFTGAYKATEHLIQNGYKRIAHFTVSFNLHIYQERMRGYRSALEDHGMAFDPDLVLEVNSDIEQGKMAAQKLIRLPDPPDAIFSSSDYSALGAMQFLKEKGIEVPGEFGIVGFSNETFTEHVTPSITTVDQKPLLMGKEIGLTFLGLIKREGDPFNPIIKKLVIEPDLLVRESSARKKNESPKKH